MILALPVIDGHDLTKVCIEHATKNAVLETTKIVVIDNASDVPYDVSMLQGYNNVPVDLIRLEENIGFYAPLKEIYDRYIDQYIGLMHNDLMLYEHGWDQRMTEAFQNDEQLGLIGLCGSREVDERGGRGGYTICNFMGREVKVGDETWVGQQPGHGQRIDGIEPAIVLDSLFMMFNRNVIPKLEASWDDWKDITLAHFYDRIWPIRTIEAGYHVITMGSDCDHIGGMTCTANERYRNDCIKWLDERGIAWREDDSGIIATERNDPRNVPCGNPETQMYLVAERRYLEEYRDRKKFLPAIILHGGSGFEINHTAR